MGVVWIAKSISSENGRGEGETVTGNLRRLVKRRGVSNKRFPCILPPTRTACFSCSLTTRCIVWGRIRQNAINLVLELPGNGECSYSRFKTRDSTKCTDKTRGDHRTLVEYTVVSPLSREKQYKNKQRIQNDRPIGLYFSKINSCLERSAT